MEEEQRGSENIRQKLTRAYAQRDAAKTSLKEMKEALHKAVEECREHRDKKAGLKAKVMMYQGQLRDMGEKLEIERNRRAGVTLQLNDAVHRGKELRKQLTSAKGQITRLKRAEG